MPRSPRSPSFPRCWASAESRAVGLLRALCLSLVLLLGAAAGVAQAESLSGQLLVARESMPDPRFQETVIYMIDHDENGAFGLVVNKPRAVGPIGALLDELGIDPGGAAGGRSITLHWGGPVDLDRGFVLHSAEYDVDTTHRVSDEIAVTSGREVLQDIARGEGPRRSLLLFGYCGWGPSQLEDELSRGDWAVTDADTELVLGTDHENKWRRALGKDEDEGLII